MAQLDSGELPDVFEEIHEVPDRDSPWSYYRMFPELLCVHGFNKLTCYPCAPLPNEGGKMALAKPNCYECKHFFVCTFYESISDAINRHINWVNVDMREPDWQKIHVAVAKACKRYEERPDD